MPIIACSHKLSCSRANCTFWHPSRANKGEIVTKIFPTVCRGGKDCSNALCGFSHPSPCTYIEKDAVETEPVQEEEANDTFIEEIFAEMDELDLSDSESDIETDEKEAFLDELEVFDDEEGCGEVFDDEDGCSEVFGVINGVGKMYPSLASFEIAKALAQYLPKLSA